MGLRWGLLGGLMLSATLVHAEVELKTLEQRISYVVGTQIGQQLEMEKVPVDKEALFTGISDYLERKEPRLSRDESQKTVDEFNHEKLMAQQKEQDLGKLQSAAFLKANRSKSGVHATKSGLQYKVLKAGSGPKPKAEDIVKVHYQGTLIDGTIFDSSYKKDEPASFMVGQVIKGWQEALQMMPTGSKWKLFIPPELGYGMAGMEPYIGPNAALIFEVELFEVTPGEVEPEKDVQP